MSVGVMPLGCHQWGSKWASVRGPANWAMWATSASRCQLCHWMPTLHFISIIIISASHTLPRLATSSLHLHPSISVWITENVNFSRYLLGITCPHKGKNIFLQLHLTALTLVGLDFLLDYVTRTAHHSRHIHS